MKKIISSLLCFFVSSIAAAEVLSSLQVYDKTTEIATKNFYDQTFRGLPWSQMVSDGRKEIMATTSLKKTEDVINALLAPLKASHTYFVTNIEAEYWALQSIFSMQVDGFPYPQVGGSYRQENHKWFVRNVYENSPLEKSGIKSGDEIVDVDGKEFEEVNSFNTSKPVTIHYRRSENAKIQTAQILPENLSAQRVLLRATHASKSIRVVGKKRVGYFHLWAGTQNDFLTETQNAIREFQDSTDLMIFDLRDGYGGAWTPYIAGFFDHDPDNDEPIPQINTKPLYVLINDGTRSGKEYLAYYLKLKKRGILVGTNTAGHFLGGRLYNIDDRSSLYLAIAGDPVGNLEGKGVAPDVEVKPAPMYSHGRDVQLEKVLELITHN
jgi:carboxyl-terminal processing protease